ncbi:hypothetical protein Agabi119p4_8856 [Agaricus bisporus var. burnettii]|uniref:DUF6534 domain-containing protein n=1 Tax=Agaricus bisporus var. burnettii TaxID=192524 RepID=A0A8H7EXF6_AGABI|nr:hypothetical protein Agabi119p4_8856 [Agaricus bisporus var. burnettii]
MILSPADHERAAWLLGPWLLGGALGIFLQGILYCQFMRYAIHFKSDGLGIKIGVFVLFLTTTLKTMHSFILVWNIFIDYFADLEGAIALSYTSWWESASSLINATLDLYVQVFFVRRLFLISNRNWYVTAVVAFILAFSYAAMCVAIYYIIEGATAASIVAPWFAAHFSALVCGDIIMTAGITYFLLRTREDVLPHTVGHFTSLIRLTWLSAAPATLCAILNLISSQLWPGTDRLLSALFNTMLPKLYAMSMMWTLNARLELRAMSTGSSDVTSGRMIFDPPFDTSLQHTHNSGRSLPARPSLESGHRVDAHELNDVCSDSAKSDKSGHVHVVDEEKA